MRFDIGRLVLNYGGQLVVGALRWHPAGRSFDGARMRLTPGPSLSIDLFWSMLNEGGANGFGDGDGYFYGAYANLGPLLGDGIALDAYALARQTNDAVDAMGVTVPWALRVHLGGRVKWTGELLDVRAEAGLQVGRDNSANAIIAGHLDAEVGVRLLDGMLRFSGHGFVASGDDPTTSENEGYNQLFPTAHLFLGLTDVMGARGNAYGGALHAQVKPIPQLTFAVDGLVFGRPQTLGENYTGTEFDAQAIWRPGAGFRIRGLYGIFIPNSGFWGAGSDPVHHVEAKIGYELN
ncbi:MAG: alginate export family protein [Sandaracinaceae bacterium]